MMRFPDGADALSVRFVMFSNGEYENLLSTQPRLLTGGCHDALFDESGNDAATN